jgi:hypothetical protein
MADLSTVESALVSLIGLALFPASTYQSGAATTSPVTGFPVKLYRGWPEQASLSADLLAGTAHCSVFPESGMTRNTTRFPHTTYQVPGVAPTVTAAVALLTVVLGGTITAGNVVGVQWGPVEAGMTAAYIVQGGDTLASVAASLAALIPGASSTGGVITLSSALYLNAVTMNPQPTVTEVRRQDQGLRVSCWCPTPAARDALAGTVDSALASLKDRNGNTTRFFAVTANEDGWLRYRSTYSNDMPARDRVWRRDLCYLVEYPTTWLELDPVMLFGGGTLTVTM